MRTAAIDMPTDILASRCDQRVLWGILACDP
jgi:hypothetical protein